MTIQEAMNKATEGGYHIYGSDGMDTYYAGANKRLLGMDEKRQRFLLSSCPWKKRFWILDFGKP